MEISRNSKIFVICIGQVGILLSILSIIQQNILIQSLAQVIAGISSLLWVNMLRGKASYLSYLSLFCCALAVVWKSPWLLFIAMTCRSIDYQIILWETPCSMKDN